MKSKREYWMTYEAKDLASKLVGYHDRYFGRTINPIYQMWLRNSYAYYSTVLDADTWMTALRFDGEQGELVKMSIPQSRSLIRQLLTLITKQKLAFNAIAQVQKLDVTEEMRIANALCEQTVTKQFLDIKTTDMVESGLVLGTGFMKATWRTDRGEPQVAAPAQDGQPANAVLYSGDIEITTPHLLDMLYDFTISNWDDLDWVEVRVKRSRWSLIAQHPNLEQEILNLASCNQDLRSKNVLGIEEDDQVYCYELYHKPIPGLEHGRMMFYSNPDTVYHDGDNEYKCIPIEQYKPEPISGMGFGYAMLSNLLPAQEMYDHDLSAIATNHSSLGVMNVTAPKGAEVSVRDIMGMNFFSYNAVDAPGGGKPETLNLLQSSPELFKLPEVLLSNMQQLTNINGAVRGELPGGTSGVAIATLTTNALEFLSGYSKCLESTLQKIMMHSINGYRRFAKAERLVAITGKNYQAFGKKFTGDMLAPITGIKIETINPLLMTMAGRIEVADKSMQNGLVTSMKDYAAILDGQPLSKLFETEVSETDLIQSENELLVDGKQVQALSIDNHPQHILKHKVLLNDPRIRADAPRTKVILDHIEEHDRLAQQTSPFLQAMANTGKMPEGGPPPPPPPAGMGPPPGGPPPPPHGAPPPGAPHGAPPSPGPPPPPHGPPPANVKQLETPQLQSAAPALPARDLLGRA